MSSQKEGESRGNAAENLTFYQNTQSIKLLTLRKWLSDMSFWIGKAPCKTILAQLYLMHNSWFPTSKFQRMLPCLASLVLPAKIQRKNATAIFRKLTLTVPGNMGQSQIFIETIRFPLSPPPSSVEKCHHGKVEKPRFACFDNSTRQTFLPNYILCTLPFWVEKFCRPGAEERQKMSFAAKPYIKL